MKRSSLVLLFVFVCVSLTTFSQTQEKIDVNKDIDIEKVYEQVVKEGYGTPTIYKKLANSYYFKSNYSEAKKWFEKLFDVEELTDKTLKFRYKQTLKALDLYAESNTYLSAGGSN